MQKMEKMTPEGLVIGFVSEPKPKKVEEKKVEETVEEEKPKRTYNKKK